MYYSIVEISMFVEHGKLYYFVMANYTILSWQFSTRILPWLFSACRPKEHGNFPFCSMVNLFFITMANFILHLLLQFFLFLTHGKFTFTTMEKLHILPWQFFNFFLFCHGNISFCFVMANFGFIDMAIFTFCFARQYFHSLRWKIYIYCYGKFTSTYMATFCFLVLPWQYFSLIDMANLHLLPWQF